MYIKPNNNKIRLKHCMKQDNFTCKRLKSGFYEKVTYNCEQLLCHQVFTSLASLPDMSWSHLNKYLFFVKVVNYIKCYQSWFFMVTDYGTKALPTLLMPNNACLIFTPARTSALLLPFTTPTSL